MFSKNSQKINLTLSMHTTKMCSMSMLMQDDAFGGKDLSDFFERM